MNDGDVAEVARRLTRRLAAVGAVDVLVGVTLARCADGRAVRAFGTQTALWGAVDLAVAGVGALRRSPAPTARRLRRVLLVNAALDVGYVATGAALALRRPGLGGRLVPAAAAGHGRAVVLQGAVLGVLDVVHARRLRPPPG